LEKDVDVSANEDVGGFPVFGLSFWRQDSGSGLVLHRSGVRNLRGTNLEVYCSNENDWTYLLLPDRVKTIFGFFDLFWSLLNPL
jgi:hypothetical protein